MDYSTERSSFGKAEVQRF